MPKNDWNQLGNDIKNIVQDAIETGDYGRLNRDLGVTLENALGNMATSVKDAAIKNLNHFSGSQQTANQRRTVSPERQRQEQNMRGYKKKLVKDSPCMSILQLREHLEFYLRHLELHLWECLE